MHNRTITTSYLFSTTYVHIYPVLNHTNYQKHIFCWKPMTPSIHKVMFNVSRLIISNEQENAWEEGLYILFGYIYLLSIHQFSQWTHFLLALTFTLAFALTFALAFFFSFVALFVVSNHAFFTGSLVERWWHYIIIITSTTHVSDMWIQMPVDCIVLIYI